MGSIRRQIVTSAKPDAVWDAIRDIGALHTRLVPGFVIDTRLEPGARVVTFGNGMVVKEPIVDIDDRETAPGVGRDRRTADPLQRHRCKCFPRANPKAASCGPPTFCRTRPRASFASMIEQGHGRHEENARSPARAQAPTLRAPTRNDRISAIARVRARLSATGAMSWPMAIMTFIFCAPA